MTKQEMADACLRVVSNRCRNLRKTLDRAKTWQEAAENGLKLNDEQLESIRSAPRKEALLAELKEILRKLTVVTESHVAKDLDNPKSTTNFSTLKTPTEVQKVDKQPVPTETSIEKSTEMELSKSSQPGPLDHHSSSLRVEKSSPSNRDSITSIPQVSEDDSQAKDKDGNTINFNGNLNVSPVVQVADGQIFGTRSPSPESVIEVVNRLGAKQSSTKCSDISKSADGRSPDSHLDVSPTSGHPMFTSQGPALSTSNHISKIIHELEEKHSKELVDIKTDCVRSVLNLFHVCDFLKQPGSRASVLNFFNATEVCHASRPLTDLDIDLLCYFYVMLTSPNGYVGHNEAVDVSTAHCLEYLKSSTSEAFKGTTYARLAEIVGRIATCPLMTDRGNHTNLPVHFSKERVLV